MTTLTHFTACLVIHDAMTAVQCEAANAQATHDHQLCRALNTALGDLAVAHSIAHGRYCNIEGTTG
jgi:hypothetical protein